MPTQTPSVSKSNSKPQSKAQPKPQPKSVPTSAPPAMAAPPSPPEVDEDLIDLADEVSAACDDWVRRVESHDCESCEDGHLIWDLAELPVPLKLAERLHTTLSRRPAQVQAFEAYCGNSMFDWLCDVCFDLAAAGRSDEALALHAQWAALVPGDVTEPLGSRALLLLQAGRPVEAKAEAERRLAENPDDLNVLARAASVYEQLDDLGRAEELCLHLYKLAEQLPDPEDRLMAGSQLLDVLRARGKDAEADKLEVVLTELELELDGEDEDGDE